MLNKSDLQFTSSFLSTKEGQRLLEVLRKICEIDSSTEIGQENGKVCSTYLAIQVGKKQVYNKLMAFKKLGGKVVS